jgi:histidyl-tRNA synthetase
MSKPGLVRGTRDFGPSVMVKRNFIFDTIKHTFQKFGFQPLETPAMENLSVLEGKYGEEGDKLLYRIRSNKNLREQIEKSKGEEAIKKLNEIYNYWLPQKSDKGLRYDLTVPFARYVVMNRSDLAIPFKRYQIQPVWRGDNPQRGRYREFYQCDADVVGTDSLICEAEIVLMLHEIFQNLGIADFTVKINNRKILTGIAETIGMKGSEVPLTVAIDKLDKIGKEKVEDELRERGFTQEVIEKLQPIFTLHGATGEVLNGLKAWLKESETGLKGVEEIEQVWSLVDTFGLQSPKIQLDITLARGLSYYTGAIFEVKANGVQMGSISGGGRYDNLTGTFGLPGLSGVGISLGVDRIYDVMEELGLFVDNQGVTTKVLLTNFDAEAEAYSLPILKKLRDAGINAEIYPDHAKLRKQFEYADRKKIPYVCVIGSEEMSTGELTLKNMESGEQTRHTIDSIIQNLK